LKLTVSKEVPLKPVQQEVFEDEEEDEDGKLDDGSESEESVGSDDD
jgi:hypothetical protein